MAREGQGYPCYQRDMMMMKYYTLRNRLLTVKWFHILLSITNNSIEYQLLVYTQLNSQTVLFVRIQFSISHLFAFSLSVKRFYLIQRWDPIRCYNPNQRGPGNNGKERVLHILQSSSVTGASPSDCLISYQDTSWVRVLPECRDAVGVFYSPSWPRLTYLW